MSETAGNLDLINTGTLTGEIAVHIDTTPTQGTIANSGSIVGSGAALYLAGAADTVINSGLIHGDVKLLGNNDLFDGRNGTQDAVYGGDGNDALLGGDRSDEIFGGAGNNTVAGNAGDDSLSGGLGNDVLTGNAGDDFILGDDGNTTIHGGTGDDSVFGGKALDLIFGRAGDDSLTGGHGNDTLNGATEVDKFVFIRGGGDDLVQAFQNGVAKLDLHFPGFANFAAVTAVAHVAGTGVGIDLSSVGGGSITIEGLTLALFDASDVLL